MVDNLSSLLDRMPRLNAPVYRGCSFPTAQARQDYVTKLFDKPKSLTGFVLTTPDPVVAMQYAKASAHPMVIVVPHSAHAVYFGPHSTHPEDEEALIDYRYYLKGVATFSRGGILYVVAEEKERNGNFNGARP